MAGDRMPRAGLPVVRPGGHPGRVPSFPRAFVAPRTQSRLLSAFFSPKGGALLELDYKPLSTNLSNVISRRKERYHKEADEHRIIYDSYQKLSFLDHLIPSDTGFNQFRDNKIAYIDNFINQL